MGSRASEGGYTLVELIAVVVIIGLLAAIGLPVYVHFTNESKDVAAQAHLREGLVAERSYHLEHGEFTADGSVLEPLVDWNAAGDPPGSVRVEMRTSERAREVCLYTRSASGRWFAIHHTHGATLYGRPDGVEGCDPDVAGGWSPEGW